MNPHKYLVLIVTIMTSTLMSCKKNVQSKMIIGKWKVESVALLASNYTAPDYNSSFTFNEDSSFITENNQFGKYLGKWYVISNNLSLIQDGGDTTLFKITELTQDKLNLIVDFGEGDLHFLMARKD